MTPSRRRFLTGLVAGPAALLAGCSEGDAGLVVVNVYVAYAESLDTIDYPHDVEVRITIENGASDARSGTLQADLHRVRTEGDSRTIVDTWTRERPVDFSIGSTRREDVVFEDVADRDDPDLEWDATARISGGDQTSGETGSSTG